MLNKNNRLKKRKEFSYIYKKGDSCASKYLILWATPTKLDHVRFGFVVNKKVGKAHVRNLVKRRMRAIVREILPQVKKNNYILVARDSLAELSFEQMKEQIVYILTKHQYLEDNQCL